MAGTLAEGGQEERVETTLTFVCTLEASRGLNKEQRVLGMRLRDCHSTWAQFSFGDGNSALIYNISITT